MKQNFKTIDIIKVELKEKINSFEKKNNVGEEKILEENNMNLMEKKKILERNKRARVIFDDIDPNGWMSEEGNELPDYEYDEENKMEQTGKRRIKRIKS